MLLCGESNSKLNHMKVRTILFAALSLAALHANAQRIKGSDTVLPVAQQTAERFMNREPDARVTVTGGGTGVGISALMDNTTDIAMASRPIKFSEKMKAKAAKRDIDEVIVAYDALAVVVHPSNPVKKLTRRHLEDMSSSLSMPATGAIIQSVSQTKGAIGYVGLAYVSPRIKTLSISYDGEHYATPTVENATNKTYPIVRPLYYYYDAKNKTQIAPLLEFILSPEGQDIIKKSGYIPVK